jgi:hypothetical protein
LNFLPVFVAGNVRAIVGNTSKTGALAAEQIFLISFGHTPAPTRHNSQPFPKGIKCLGLLSHAPVLDVDTAHALLDVISALIDHVV